MKSLLSQAVAAWWPRQKRPDVPAAAVPAHAVATAPKRRAFVPRSLIAGSLPVARDASPLQVAYNAACLALDTERIVLIAAREDDRVHYLAGAGADFASQGNVTTLLASALPGNPHHRGHGSYFCAVDDTLHACVITTSAGVKCFVGTEEDVERFPVTEGVPQLPVFQVGSAGAALEQMPPWRAFSEYDRGDNRLLLQRLLTVGIALNGVMGLLWVGASLYASYASAQAQDLATQARAVITAASNAFAQDGGNHHPAWQEFQNVSRFALEYQGRITAFAFQDGKLNWSLVVPEFVTGDQIQRAFGSVQTKREDGRIRISKTEEGK